MGDIHGTRTTEELLPHFNWIEDSMGHYLSLHLPGFKKEDVMVGLAYPGYVTISGERLVNDQKSMYFGQALKLPDNLDMKKVVQSFQDEMLSLTFPKRIPAKSNSQEELINGGNLRKHEEQREQSTDDVAINAPKEMRKKGGILERAIILLTDHIVLTVMLAFSLGALVSIWFESYNGE